MLVRAPAAAFAALLLTAAATAEAASRPEIRHYQQVSSRCSGFALAFIQDAPVATQGTSEVFYAALHTLPAVR